MRILIVLSFLALFSIVAGANSMPHVASYKVLNKMGLGKKSPNSPSAHLTFTLKNSIIVKIQDENGKIIGQE